MRLFKRDATDVLPQRLENASKAMNPVKSLYQKWRSINIIGTIVSVFAGVGLSIALAPILSFVPFVLVTTVFIGAPTLAFLDGRMSLIALKGLNKVFGWVKADALQTAAKEVFTGLREKATLETHPEDHPSVVIKGAKAAEVQTLTSNLLQSRTNYPELITFLRYMFGAKQVNKIACEATSHGIYLGAHDLIEREQVREATALSLKPRNKFSR